MDDCFGLSIVICFCWAKLGKKVCRTYMDFEGNKKTDVLLG